MSRNKDIAKQVKELVWDVSQEVGLDINKQHLLLDQSPGNRAALNRLMQRLGTVREHGLDFQVLLTVLPRFPNLISVTFAQIMTPWMTVWHNVGFLPHDRSAFYDSPAMRAWVKLGIGPVYPILYSPSRHFPTRLVKYIHAWAASFVNPWYRQGLPTCRMPQLRHSSSREPVLLLVALYTLGKQLRELHVESFMSSRWHKLFRTNSFTHYHGLDTPAFTTIFQKTPQFLDAFKPLEHLSLSVGSERMRTFTTMWKASLGSVLKRAPNVRVLYIRLGAQAFDNLNLRDIEECTRLEELVLDNYHFNASYLKHAIIPLCFRTGLRRVLLLHCRILPPGKRDWSLVEYLGKAHAVSRITVINSLPEGDSLGLTIANPNAQLDPLYLVIHRAPKRSKHISWNGL